MATSCFPSLFPGSLKLFPVQPFVFKLFCEPQDLIMLDGVLPAILRAGVGVIKPLIESIEMDRRIEKFGNSVLFLENIIYLHTFQC